VNAVPLLLIAAVAHIGPESFARLFGGRVGPWETVCYGIEATLLYLYAMARTGRPTRGELAAAMYGAFEAVQRPLCRPLLPMDAPAGLKHGQYLCDVATGFPVSMLSPIVLFAVLLVVVKDITQPTKVCSSNKENKGT
jgi:hypothetical protein